MSDREARAFALRQVVLAGAEAAGIRLALQLFDLAPCPRCDYVHDRCRCPSDVLAHVAKSASLPSPLGLTTGTASDKV